MTVSSGLSANNKAYDGTANATLTSNNVALAGVLAGDAGNVLLVTNGYVANFNNGSAGNGKPVTVSGLSLGGQRVGELQFDATDGIECEHHGLGGDGQQRVEREQQGL